MIAPLRLPKFELGRVVITPAALESLALAGEDPAKFLRRHHAGDWGSVCPDDAAENDLSVREGFRILSAYETARGERVWIITEADRSATTILLPADY